MNQRASPGRLQKHPECEQSQLRQLHCSSEALLLPRRKLTLQYSRLLQLQRHKISKFLIISQKLKAYKALPKLDYQPKKVKIKARQLSRTCLNSSHKDKSRSLARRPEPLYRELSQKPYSLQTNSFAFIVTTGDGAVLMHQNAGCQLKIASLTKIMTLLLTLQHYAGRSKPLEENWVTIPVEAILEGTTAGLFPGDRLRVVDLAMGMMLPSGNDAAAALAYCVGRDILYDEEDFEGQRPSPNAAITRFVKLMNDRAGQLGLSGTMFANPHGLHSSDGRSTARDVAHLVRQALKVPAFRGTVQRRSYSCQIYNWGKSRKLTWHNTNKLLEWQGFRGVKTGYTMQAGHCLSSLYAEEGLELVVVVLRSMNRATKFKDTRTIVEHILRKCNRSKKLAKKQSPVC